MPDREKVIENLKAMSNICAVNGDIQSMRTIGDTISLLEEQEPVKPYHLHNAYFTTNITKVRFEHQCTNCSCYLLPNWKACPLCGKGLKWDD